MRETGNKQLKTMPSQVSVAVIFADIRGFTTLSERLAAVDALALLQDFHARMERIVRRHGGHLSSTSGDGLLITFGAPIAGLADATNALVCAREMLVAQAQWNAHLDGEGGLPFTIGVGAHFGAVALGAVGAERSKMPVVIGDTVNVANRLESLTRSLETDLVVSTRLVEEVCREAERDRTGAMVDDLVPIGAQELRGRAEKVGAHILPRQRKHVVLREHRPAVRRHARSASRSLRTRRLRTTVGNAKESQPGLTSRP
jgi:adenylate cyclase